MYVQTYGNANTERKLVEINKEIAYDITTKITGVRDAGKLLCKKNINWTPKQGK
jgi:hypothetical protein